MREIKFRAWDSFKKKMYSFEELDEKDMYNDINFYSLLKGEYSEVKAHQYTGLKDKNGVEIYEGDLLKLANSTLKLTFMGDYNFGYILHYAKTGDYLSMLNVDQLKRIEVIGNIYENPELLEGDTK